MLKINILVFLSLIILGCNESPPAKTEHESHVPKVEGEVHNPTLNDGINISLNEKISIRLPKSTGIDHENKHDNGAQYQLSIHSSTEYFRSYIISGLDKSGISYKEIKSPNLPMTTLRINGDGFMAILHIPIETEIPSEGIKATLTITNVNF